LRTKKLLVGVIQVVSAAMGLSMVRNSRE